MKLTKPQQFLYWREFNAALRAHPEPKPDAAAFRHMLHRQALGYDLSMKELGNAQFDAVLGVFRAHTQPDNLEAQVRLANMARTRLLYGLRHSGFADAYLLTICRDKFGSSSSSSSSSIPLSFLDDLTDPQLQQLRDTLADRRVEQHKPETIARRQSRRAKNDPSDQSVPSDRSSRETLLF